MAVNPLLRFGFARPHLFVATVPGGGEARLAVERFARTRGWPIAASPADADLLVVCGTPGGWLAEAVEVVWGQLPAPRARLEVIADEQVPDLLTDAQRRLLLDPTVAEPEHAMHHQVEEHAGHDMHSEHHGDHHGHGGTVAGLPMAGRGTDRDGLNLDEVHVALGPFLPAWPAGLRLRLTLQGDVASEVAADHVPSTDTGLFSGSPQRLAAGRLDAFAALAEVAGDDRSAHQAVRLRDALLSNREVRAQVQRFASMRTRSRLLRRATDGVTAVGGFDATARWQGWLDDAVRALTGDEYVVPLAATGIDQLPPVLSGLEFGGLRIAVASLIPPTGGHGHG